MYLDKHCPGCGGGPGNQSCKIAKCSIERGGYEYCHLCEDYPCEKYIGIDEYDSFISHHNQLQDMIHLKTVGSEAYRAMLMEKATFAAECFKTVAKARNNQLKPLR